MRERLLAMLGLGTLLSACHIVTPTPADDAGKVDSGGACGSATCGEGTVCCNASCGICTPPGSVCIQIACDPATAGKTCADLKCDAGETCQELRTGPQCVTQEENPCAATLCPINTTCAVVNGAAECQPIAAADASAPDASREDPGTGAGSCAVTLCPVGTICDDIGGTAKCIKAPSCDKVSCEAGQHCELKPVQCIRAPCPAQPTCVADVPDACATVRCKAGTHCQVTPIQCVTTPCNPIVECVPDEASVKCGSNTCGAGQYCCDALCGKCAPKGAFCTQGCAAP